MISQNTISQSWKEIWEYDTIKKTFVLGYAGYLLGCLNLIAFKIFINYEFSDQSTCTQLPESVYQYADTVRNALIATLPSKDIFTVLVLHAPIVEEVIFRLGLQEILLKKIPAKVLSNQIVNSKAAATARVIFTAAAFALIHANRQEQVSNIEFCSLTRLGSTFVLGLFTGTIQEITGNTAYSMLFHATWNISPAAFSLIVTLLQQHLR